MSIKDAMEMVRQELLEYIEQYDLNDPRTVSKSQQLDELHNAYEREQKKCA